MTIDPSPSFSAQPGLNPRPAGAPSPSGYGAQQYSAGPPVGFSGNSSATWALVALLMPFGSPAALFLGLRAYKVAAANGGEGMAKSVLAIVGGGLGTAVMLLLLLGALAG